MRLCRFDDNRLGLVNGTTVRDVSAALDVLPAFRYPLPAGDVLISNLEQLTREIRSVAGRSASVPLKGLTLLSPVANPGKLIGAPVNYQKHLDEVRQNPQLHHGNDIPVIQKAGVFLKATSSLVGPGEGIVLRKLDRRNDHEVELAFVIGKPASNVSRRRRARLRRRLQHRPRHHDSWAGRTQPAEIVGQLHRSGPLARNA